MSDLSRAADHLSRRILECGKGEQRVREIRLRAPIKRGVRIEDLQTAHQHDQQDPGVQPMREPHEKGVTVKRNPRLPRFGVCSIFEKIR